MADRTAHRLRSVLKSVLTTGFPSVCRRDLAAATVIVRESGGIVVGYRRPEGIDKSIPIADEPFDLNGRKVLCIRGCIEGKEYQSKMLGEVREKLTDIEIESD